MHARAGFFNFVKNKYESGDLDLQELLDKLYKFCQENTLIDGALLAPKHDFLPIIFRDREINVLVGSTSIESLHCILKKFRDRLDDSEAILETVDNFSSQSYLIFLSLLMALERSVESLQDVVHDYLEHNREKEDFSEDFGQYLEKNLLPEIKLQDQIVLKKILTLYRNQNVSLSLLIAGLSRELEEEWSRYRDDEMMAEKDDGWSSSTIILFGQNLREYVDSTLDLVSLALLLVKYIPLAYKTNPHDGQTIPSHLRIELEDETKLRDLAHTLIGLKKLSLTRVNPSTFKSLRVDEQNDYAFMDLLTYFCLVEKKKYLTSYREYSSREVRR